MGLAGGPLKVRGRVRGMGLGIGLGHQACEHRLPNSRVRVRMRVRGL